MRKAVYIGCDPGSDPGSNALAEQQAEDGQLKERPVGLSVSCSPCRHYSMAEFTDRMDSFLEWASRHPGTEETARRLSDVSRLAASNPAMFNRYTGLRKGALQGPIGLLAAGMAVAGKESAL